MEKYDAIIIGSGQAANPLAQKLPAAGWRTALIEKKWIGGTCINTGCTPSKTAIASGRVAYLTKRSAVYGIRTTGWSVDMETVIRRKNAHVLAARESSSKRLLETHNLNVHFGTAMFTGHKEVTVMRDDGSTGTITAENIFVNAGTRPLIPSIPGLADVPYFTSENILDLLVVPAHLAIIGGGYIALELGQLYRRLGSEVTIIEGNTRFLSKEDPDIAAEMKKILEEDGIRILTGATVERVEAAPPGIRLELGRQNGPGQTGASPILASHVLVAAGRMPDTAALNPGATGIELDKHGFIAVDDKLETNVAGIYALGDVKGGPQFTHVSYNDHLVVYQNLIEKAGRSIAGRPLLYCVFTDPELGRVGLTETAAREKGLDIKVATMRAERIARAWENDETRGLLKAIVDARTKKILGAAILSSAGGELMSILQMAMMGGIPYDALRDTMFAHPTFAESLNVLFAEIR
jgi:pyruvate/2-oxoglutarate dehydrogenase complex dihydrolipoamide dehydrogenase (E3) component